MGTHLGQSLWLREVRGREDGPPPTVDLLAEAKSGRFVRELIANGAATAVHDVSDGGLLVAITEMALAGNIGAQVDLWTRHDLKAPLAEALFGEDQGRYVVTAPRGTDLRPAAKAAGVHAMWIGQAIGDAIDLIDTDVEPVPLDELRRAHEGFFTALTQGELGA
jgi:phosphoribosylformylglycinamidine synthase